MSSIAIETERHLPLTQLSAEEELLQATVRKFARREIAPLVREMDESQVMNPALVRKLFDQGFMGIEVDQGYGGVGASFFSSILVIEEISRSTPPSALWSMSKTPLPSTRFCVGETKIRRSTISPESSATLSVPMRSARPVRDRTPSPSRPPRSLTETTSS